MKKISSCLRIIAYVIPFALISCEEVIEIDLNSSDPVVVAEAYMDEDSVCFLSLSYTSDYFDNEPSERIEDARAWISTPGEREEEMDHIGNGIYSGHSLQGLVHNIYTLQVDVDEKSFSGSSKLLPRPIILGIKYGEVLFGPPGQEGETSYALKVSFQNNQDQADNFMLKFLRNGVPYGTWYNLATDKYSSTSDSIHYISIRLPFYLGDEVDITVYSIDEEAYSYYRQMNDINGGGNPMATSTPYNPASNMGQEILGYFAARSKVDTTIVLEQHLEERDMLLE